MSSAAGQIDLDKILKNKSIATWFQPIVSVKQHAIIGYEALSRGIHPCTQELIAPHTLFSVAEATNKLVELDRICREKALENYKPLSTLNERTLLFINFDTAIIDKGVVGSGNLISCVQRFGYNPASVVIEIIESKVCDIGALKSFVGKHKELGFLIALDDLGNGHSNLDRIFHVRPDIIKIDRWLISELDTDYYKQELFKALVYMAKKTGSLVIAEGVETEAEALASLEFGADLLQGYYFSKPQPLEVVCPLCFNKKLNHVSASFRHSKLRKITNDYCKKNDYHTLLLDVLTQLSKTTPDQFESTLQQVVLNTPLIQYLYVLNIAGTQITDSIGVPGSANGQTAGIFQADRSGTDQSLKDYCLFVQAGLETYMTEPYMSLANGKPCITYSIAFRDSTKNQYILCADFSP
ncbi:EAL domain-containing protein [Sporomusa sp.]|uniref:EAL domain-containing protein n=1 Tax=Sporomusa sp. TaxID=2078658 RepID=UPI002C93C9E7|nr:EAL domain-containing protein [Sporomusa sp.]HWR45717.1 EAL domain-containing protein [Sporomusa sp.]